MPLVSHLLIAIFHFLQYRTEKKRNYNLLPWKLLRNESCNSEAFSIPSQPPAYTITFPLTLSRNDVIDNKSSLLPENRRQLPHLVVQLVVLRSVDQIRTFHLPLHPSLITQTTYRPRLIR